MCRKMLGYFTLPLLLLLSNSSGNSASQLPGKSPERQTGTRERLIVGSGTVAMDLDLGRLKGIDSGMQESKRERVRFEVGPNSFFTILVFDNVLRGPEPGSIGLIWGNSRILPEPLLASSNQLVIEKAPSGEQFDLVVRDGKTGFVFFNIEGNLYDYDPAARLLSINSGRLLISEEFANKLGRPADAGVIVGEISIATTMYPIEITTVVNGAVQSAILPPRQNEGPNVPTFVPGPDVIVGDLPSMTQFGSNGTQVGLGVGTTSCNNGTVELNWFALSNTDHPVIPQELYRMSGGATNDERFEQVGQSWLKHAFTALQGNACGFGCTPASSGTHLGVGCSDPYDASLNANQGALGSRAWVNPFTGVFPSTASNHTGHTHTGVTHRVLVEMSDLDTTLNPGATYYAEAQYVTPHEYVWCQAHPGECNMYNNASYRRFNVTGTTSFNFSPVGPTVRTTSAINVWTGATINPIEPVPGTDGRAFIAYKVTNPSAGVWHYEYAVYNQNLDRGIQSFNVPLGIGITVSNLGFHAPLNQPGIANDGTLGSTGYSNAAWTSNQTARDLSWSSETFAQNQNANALRWGTLYNFRFDSNSPPQAANATIGFFKTGTPITVGVQGPAGSVTPTPTATGTPPPTPTATATATASPTPTATIPPSATPTPCAVTVSYTGPPVAVPDNIPDGANIILPVSGVGTISDLNFRLDALAGCSTTIGNPNASVTHTFLGDLTFKLTSPVGTTVNLIVRRGGAGDNYCTVLLDDDGGFPPASAIPTTGAVTGNFAPESPLSAFDGQNANGNWTLNVSDNAGIDTGTLNRFSLIFSASCETPTPTATPPQLAHRHQLRRRQLRQPPADRPHRRRARHC